MTSTQVIRDIFQNGLDANFLQQLRNMYQHNVTGGAFSGLEEEYTTGITALKSTLSSDMEKSSINMSASAPSCGNILPDMVLLSVCPVALNNILRMIKMQMAAFSKLCGMRLLSCHR